MTVRNRERNRAIANCTGFNFGHADASVDRVTAVVDFGEMPASNYVDVNGAMGLMALNGNYRKIGWGSTTRLVSQDESRLFNYSISVGQLSGGVATLQATIYFNPTRCFVYWEDALPDANNIGRKIWATPDLKAAQIRVSRDNNDNFIPKSKLTLARGMNWDGYTKDVLALIVTQIQEDILENSGRVSVSLHPERQWKWVIQSLEVYWEFQHADAAGVLRRMYANAQSQFVLAREKYFMQNTLSVVGSSYTYELKRKNTVCSAYAKLDDRIRLECRFMVNPRLIFSDEINLDKYPNTNLSFLTGFLHVLITKAIRLMEPFTELDASMFEAPQVSLADLILLFSKLERLNQDAKHDVINSLIDSGRVAVPLPKTPTAQVVRRLKTLGLLVKGPHKRRQTPFYYPQGELARVTTGLRSVQTPIAAA